MGQSRADIAARGVEWVEGSSPVRPHSLPHFSPPQMESLPLEPLEWPYRSHGWRNGCSEQYAGTRYYSLLVLPKTKAIIVPSYDLLYSDNQHPPL